MLDHLVPSITLTNETTFKVLTLAYTYSLSRPLVCCVYFCVCMQGFCWKSSVIVCILYFPFLYPQRWRYSDVSFAVQYSIEFVYRFCKFANTYTYFSFILLNSFTQSIFVNKFAWKCVCYITFFNRIGIHTNVVATILFILIHYLNDRIFGWTI